MKYHLSAICIYVCLTIGSMENLKSDIKVTIKSKELDTKKETEAVKKTLETKNIDDKKEVLEKQTQTDINENVETKEKLETKEKIETNEKIETKGNIDTKENLKNTKGKEESNENKPKQTVNKRKYYKRKSFATKDDIPEDYLEYLKKRYNILEDPVGDYERKMAEYEFYDDYDYDSNYDKETDTGEEILEGEEVNESLENNNETEDSCKQCKVLESDKKLRLETIKNTILDKIGFSSSNLPNMTGKTVPKIPSILRLIEQHEMQSDAPYRDADDYLPEDDFYGQVKKAYTIAQEPPDHFKIHVPGGCYFELTESVTSRKVKDASLWIYLEPSAFKQKTVVEIYIYVVPQKAKPKHILKGPVRYKKTSASGWIEFKFAHIVHHWIKQPGANRGVVIQALDEDGNNRIVTPGKHSDETFVPTLEMSTVEYRDEHHRQKRSYNYICTETERIDSCCRYPLRVDFVQFGWDWVIAPTGYMANYCSGECLYRHMEVNPQAYIIQQAPNGSGPCCTPSKFFPLAMLYFDHHHTVLYTYMQKMIVVRCSCA